MLEDVKRERERELPLLPGQISPVRIISLLLLSSWNEGNAISGGGETWPGRGHPMQRLLFHVFSGKLYRLPCDAVYWVICMLLGLPQSEAGTGKFGGATYSWRIDRRYLQFPTPLWWWCHLRPCRTGKMLPWTQRFAPLSVDRPISSEDIRAVSGGGVGGGGGEGGGEDVNVRRSKNENSVCYC